MGVFKKAIKEQAFLKAGFFGFEGSGKTLTALYTLIGVAKKFGPGKPIFFFDTETGSDWVLDILEIEKIPFYQAKSRAFTDLLAGVQEALDNGAIGFLTDSVTHVWKELAETYKKKKDLYKMAPNHWVELKGSDFWGKWTDLFLNCPIHMAVCGRAGYEYESEADEKGKMTEFVKVGTKMKVEGEFGYEPSLLIEMERLRTGKDVGAGWIHRANILKDRSRLINGKWFDFDGKPGKYKAGDYKAVYESFLPHIQFLNIGGIHSSVDPAKNSGSLFTPDGNSIQAELKEAAQVAIDEVGELIKYFFGGQDAESKKTRQVILDRLFQTLSWEACKLKSFVEADRARRILYAVKKVCEEAPPSSHAEFLEILDQEIKVFADAEMKAEANGFDNDTITV